jgi:hypothetical protein
MFEAFVGCKVEHTGLGKRKLPENNVKPLHGLMPDGMWVMM